MNQFTGIPFEGRDTSDPTYRDTSRRTWEHIRDNALMAGSHFDLYTVVVDHYPVTAAEATVLFNERFGTDLSRNEIAKRMSNLHYNYKVICEVGERICTVNNKPTLVYAPNNALPSALPKNRLSKKEQIEVLKSALQISLSALTRPLSNEERDEITVFLQEVTQTI